LVDSLLFSLLFNFPDFFIALKLSFSLYCKPNFGASKISFIFSFLKALILLALSLADKLFISIFISMRAVSRTGPLVQLSGSSICAGLCQRRQESDKQLSRRCSEAP
jgi:hypothetical protein